MSPQQNPKKSLGDLELRVMFELWSREDATVGEIHEALESERKIAYTTVLTTMRNLEKKGYLGRRADGRAHRYHAVIDQATVARRSVSDVMARFFDGSVAKFANAFLDEDKLTPREFELLRQDILELRRKEGEGDE